MHACEILVIIEENLSSQNHSKLNMKQLARFDVRDQLAKSTNPPILDHNYTPKIPKDRILELLTKRSKKLDSSSSYSSSGIESLSDRSGFSERGSLSESASVISTQSHTPTKRFHSAGRSRNKLPWAKTSSSTTNKISSDSLVSSLLPDKLEIQAKGKF